MSEAQYNLVSLIPFVDPTNLDTISVYSLNVTTTKRVKDKEAYGISTKVVRKYSLVDNVIKKLLLNVVERIIIASYAIVSSVILILPPSLVH